MVNKAKTKKAMRQFTPKRTNIASTGGTPLELPNHSRGKAPEADRGLVNKKYVDDEITGAGVLDWTISQAPTVIHADNYTDTNTTYTSSDFTHDDLIAGTIADHDTSATGAELDTLTDGSSTTLHNHTHANATGQTTDDHHAESHDIASHSDTSATGAELDTLTDNSIANTLHRHSELVASDGAPDPALSVDATGKVGIGTTSPAEKLHINSFTTNADGFIYIASEGSDIADLDTGIKLRAHNDNYGFTIQSESTSGDDDGLNFLYHQNNATGSSAMFIQRSDGNVGIGTTDPGAKLDIKGDTTTWGGMAKIFLTDSNVNIDSRNWLMGNGGSAYGSLSFFVSDTKDGNPDGNADGSVVMVMNKAGNVGIGVIDPHSKLEVDGAISSAILNVTASGDNIDVSGVNTIFVNITGNIIIGGLTGGVTGQVLNIVYKGNYTNTLTLEDTKGVGDQDMYMHTRADEVLDGGGVTFICDGSNWYDCSHARHV